MELELFLRRKGRLGADLYQQVKDAILDGRLRPGEPVPATRTLAEAAGVSRNTVLHAYERLTAEGFLVGRAGAGTLVHPDVVAAMRRRAPQTSALAARPLFRGLPADETSSARLRWDFRIGVPDASLFPWDEWRRRVARSLRRSGRDGMYLPPEGDPRARAAVARHIGLARTVRASADDLVLTSGAQQALDLIGRVLIEPGAKIAMEDPGYPPARALFASLGARVVPVPVDGEGLVVDALPSDARLVYVTPSHQFPLGMPMSLARRLALLAWSERTGAAIVEDDYDSEFRFDARPLEPLQSLDRRGRVLYVGTFSKTLLPSLRLGFVVAPGGLVPALREAKSLSDGHADPAPQRALAGLIEDGLLARHVRRLQREYAERRERIHESVLRHLGPLVEQLPSHAGLHHSVRFVDPELDVDALCRRAREVGVAAQPLTAYFQRDAFPALALGYGRVRPGAIDSGIRQLAASLPSRKRRGGTKR